MKDYKGRKVTYVKLHGSDAFVPGVGSLGTTLPSSSKTFHIEMEATEAGVLYNISYQGKKAEGIFPWGNVQMALFGPSETKPAFTVVETKKAEETAAQ